MISGWTTPDWECAWSEPEQCEPTPSHLDREGGVSTASAIHRIDIEGYLPPIRTAVANPEDPEHHFVMGRVNTLNGQFNHGFVRLEPTDGAVTLQSSTPAILRGKGLVTAVTWQGDGVEGLLDDYYERGFGEVGDLSRFDVRFDRPADVSFQRVAELPDRTIHDLSAICLHPTIERRCDALIRLRPEEDGVHFDVWRDGEDEFSSVATVEWPTFGGGVADWYLSPTAPNMLVIAFDEGVLLVDVENEFAAREVAFTHPIAQPDLGYVQFGLDAVAVRWALDAQVEPQVVRIAAVDHDAGLEEVAIALPPGPVQPPFGGLGPGRIGPDYQHVGDTDGDGDPEVLVLVRWPNLLDDASEAEFMATTILELDTEARSSRLESMFLRRFAHSLEGPYDWNGDGIDDVTISDDDTMYLFFMG